MTTSRGEKSTIPQNNNLLAGVNYSSPSRSRLSIVSSVTLRRRPRSRPHRRRESRPTSSLREKLAVAKSAEGQSDCRCFE